MTPPGEYHCTVRVRCWCGLLSNYFDHLLLVVIIKPTAINEKLKIINRSVCIDRVTCACVCDYIVVICIFCSILCVQNVRNLSLGQGTMRRKVLPTVRHIIIRYHVSTVLPARLHCVVCNTGDPRIWWHTGTILPALFTWSSVSRLTFDFYRQHCAQRNAPVFNLLRGQFWGFLCHGQHIAPMGVKFDMEDAKFHPISAMVRV